MDINQTHHDTGIHQGREDVCITNGSLYYARILEMRLSTRTKEMLE
jgi:hypothetical protein